MPNRRISGTFTGLGTFSVFTVPVTDVYQIIGTLSNPSVSAGDGTNSQVVVVIKQNASTIYTGAAGAKGFAISAQLTAADVVSLVLTSSASVDQPTNVIKTTLTIVEGNL